MCLRFRKFIFVVAALLAACSSTPEGDVIGEVNDLYNEGLDQVMSKKFSLAIHTFEELERQHPYSVWATRAQMMIPYAHFRLAQYDEAVVAAERFIRLHPGHENLPYLHYIRALSFYNRISDVARDQAFTKEALQAFEELATRYPDSVYARDARLKATLCRDHLAGKEMQVGRYYQGKKLYGAAINRFQAVLDKYQTSTHTPEALYRLTESFLALGVDKEAKRNAAILGHNFPESDWYEDAYALLTGKNLAPAGKEKSWATQIWKGLEESF